MQKAHKMGISSYIKSLGTITGLTTNQKVTSSNLVRITTLGKPRPFLGVVLCFVEMLSVA